MKLVVGLGNPGKEYDKTRHNCGFRAIDFYAEKNNLSYKSKFNGLYADLVVNNEKLIIFAKFFKKERKESIIMIYIEEE